MPNDQPFDVPYISEIALNLWQGGCKDGLVLPEFIISVVSLYSAAKYTMNPGTVRYEIEMQDSIDQAFDQVDDIARLVNELRSHGPTLVHCQAGLNRSSLITARALMFEGLTADEAISLIRQRRSPSCLCNPMFEDWLRSQ